MCFRERQRFHQSPRLVLGLRIHQQDDAFAISARIPLANFPAEIEPYRRLNLVRNHSHDLLNGYTRLGSLNDKYCGGFRYGPGGQALASPGLRLREGGDWKHCHKQSDHEFHCGILSILFYLVPLGTIKEMVPLGTSAVKERNE